MQKRVIVENHGINLVRFLAALQVTVSHARIVLIADWDNVHHTILQKILFGMTALGKQAVVVFFVLSGFWVGGVVLRHVKQGRFIARNYLSDRCVRLWLVLLPCLLLTFLLDTAGHLAFPAADVYTGGAKYAGVITRNSNLHDGFALLGNVFFLQGVIFAPYGSNSALWSIGVEFWMYVVGAMIIFAAIARSPISLILACAAIGLCGWANSQMLVYLPIWLLGAAISGMEPMLRQLGNRVPRMVVPARVGAALLTVGVSLVVRGLNDLPLWEDVGAVAIPTALLLAALAARPQTDFEERHLAWGSRLAASSYSLYAIHVPILVFCAAALGMQADLRPQPTVAGWLGVFCFTTFVLVVAHFYAKLTEARTAQVRQFVRAGAAKLARKPT